MSAAPLIAASDVEAAAAEVRPATSPDEADAAPKPREAPGGKVHWPTFMAVTILNCPTIVYAGLMGIFMAYPIEMPQAFTHSLTPRQLMIFGAGSQQMWFAGSTAWLVSVRPRRCGGCATG